MVHEVDEELREIKREIIESRGLVIKTNNLTNALSADLKSIAKRQQGAERRLVLTSVTAYFVFLKVAWDARVDQVRAETEESRRSAERSSRELKDAQKRDEDRARAESRAVAFYEIVRQSKRVEALEQWETLKKEPLTKTEIAAFGDAVERFRGELSIAAYQQGL